MQSSLVQLEHEREQKKLLALGKAAMTQTESQTESQTEPQTERAGEAASLSTADSATQVEPCHLFCVLYTDRLWQHSASS